MKLARANTKLPYAAGIIALCAVSLSHAQSGTEEQSDTEEVETLYVSEQYSYDDNLFRLSRSAGALEPLPDGVVAREDYVNRLTAGIGEDLELGRQVFTLTGRAQDVRFAENDHLDHVAGRGSLTWDWLLTSALTGELQGEYNRSLADFANSRGTLKDVLETTAYSGAVRYKLGPRWMLLADGQRTTTEHGLELRRTDDFEASSGRFGIQYSTPTQHTVAVEYRYIDAQFPNLLPDSASQHSGDYEENAALARLSYTFSVHTHLHAMYGYVEREHTNDVENRYSGNTWRTDLTWRPRAKFSTKLSAWRELRAYVDAESDYFVSDGASITPSWSPIRQLSFSLSLSLEEQEYLGFEFDPTLEATSARADDVVSALATFVYTPRENLELELSYRSLDRDSNRDFRRYDAAVAAASIRWRIL